MRWRKLERIYFGDGERLMVEECWRGRGGEGGRGSGGALLPPGDMVRASNKNGQYLSAIRKICPTVPLKKKKRGSYDRPCFTPRHSRLSSLQLHQEKKRKKKKRRKKMRECKAKKTHRRKLHGTVASPRQMRAINPETETALSVSDARFHGSSILCLGSDRLRMESDSTGRRVGRSFQGALMGLLGRP